MDLKLQKHLYHAYYDFTGELYANMCPLLEVIAPTLPKNRPPKIPPNQHDYVSRRLGDE